MYHKSKRVGNPFVQQRALPEHYTTHVFDQAKKEREIGMIMTEMNNTVRKTF